MSIIWRDENIFPRNILLQPPTVLQSIANQRCGTVDREPARGHANNFASKFATTILRTSIFICINSWTMFESLPFVRPHYRMIPYRLLNCIPVSTQMSVPPVRNSPMQASVGGWHIGLLKRHVTVAYYCL